MHTRGFTLAFVIALVNVVSAVGQDSAVAPQLRNAIAIRAGFVPALSAIAIEYNYHVHRFISVDASGWAAPNSFLLGGSLWPISWAGLQAAAGLTDYGEDQGTDNPGFAAEYAYTLTATVRIPIRRSQTSTLFVSAAVGNVWFVDRDYVYSGGGLGNTDRPVLQRVEQRTAMRLELGLGAMF